MIEENEIRKRTGRIIRQMRLNKRISQEELAFRTKISTTFLSEIERGIKTPTVYTIWKIALMLETTPTNLIEKIEKIEKNEEDDDNGY